MRLLTFALPLCLLIACAATDPRQEQAIRDFIEVGELAALDKIRTDDRDSYAMLNDKFIIYKARNEDYLMEFRRACYDMVERNLVPDVRRESRTIRARFDTLNGCLIEGIYALLPGQSAELIDLAAATE